MRTAESYWARIYVAIPDRFTTKVAIDLCQMYVDSVGLCVTVTETDYIFSGGKEHGVIVGLINYPRFPATPAKIRKRAIALAIILKKVLKQKRVSIEFPDETVMLGGVK